MKNQGRYRRENDNMKNINSKKPLSIVTKPGLVHDKNRSDSSRSSSRYNNETPQILQPMSSVVPATAVVSSSSSIAVVKQNNFNNNQKDASTKIKRSITSEVVVETATTNDIIRNGRNDDDTETKSNSSKKRKRRRGNISTSATTTTATTVVNSSKLSASDNVPMMRNVPQQQQQQRHHHTRKKYTNTVPLSPAVIEFSMKLKELVQQQRQRRVSSSTAAAAGIQQQQLLLLQLYYHPQYDTIRDEHHACIVIDACAKNNFSNTSTSANTTTTTSNCESSVDIAEQVISHLLATSASAAPSSPAASRNTLSSLNIETLTALLKVYVHSGDMYKAWDLFRNHILYPNVRTLNTLLRGCLWSATTITTSTASLHLLQVPVSLLSTTKPAAAAVSLLCGGVVTSELAWQHYLNKHQTSKSKHQNNNNNMTIDDTLGSNTPTTLNIMRQSFDTSSYEYSIQLLCQSLRVDIATQRIDEYCTIHNIRFKGTAKTIYNNTNSSNNKNSRSSNDDDLSSAAIFETLAVIYLALSRAYAIQIVVLLLTTSTDAGQLQDNYNMNCNHTIITEYCTVLWTCCQRCLSAIKLSRAMLQKRQREQMQENSDKDAVAITKNRRETIAGGGKRGWTKNVSSSAAATTTAGRYNETGQQREISNMAYRTHRLSELEMDVLSLLKHCKYRKANISSNDDKHQEDVSTTCVGHAMEKQQKQDTSESEEMICRVAQQFQSKLLYFSGGAVTSTTTPSNDDDKSIKKKRRLSRQGKQMQDESTAVVKQDPKIIRHQLMLASWYSFGLSQIVTPMMKKTGTALEEETSILDATGTVDKDVISFTEMQLAANTGKGSIIRDDGMINIDAIFTRSPTMKQLPLDIEIGAGFGTWIVEQARRNNNDRNYIAMELRADRCYQIYTRTMVSHTKPIQNLCVIGCDCNTLLRERIVHHTVSTFYAHHPEPPTQVLGNNESFLHQLAQGGNNTIVEPVHMLHSTTIMHMCKCLKKDGFIVIVSDNRSYIRLVAATFTKVVRDHVQRLKSVSLDEIKRGVIHSFDDTILLSLHQLESFQSLVNVYCYDIATTTNPNNANTTNSDGTSYFDRLWRTGAGTHSETHTRFVIVMQLGRRSV